MKAVLEKCAICARPIDRRYHPFCSRRCAQVDLARWVAGCYVISGAALGDEVEEPPDEPLKDAPGDEDDGAWLDSTREVFYKRRAKPR